MKNLIFVTLILTLLITVSLVNATGFSVSPAFIKVFNLEKGQELKQTVTVKNPSDITQTFSINATGDTVDWMIFYSFENPDEEINQITVPSNSTGKFIAFFQIPEGIPNGYYNSIIYVGGASSGSAGDNTSSLTIRLPITVSLNVIGEQILKGEIKNITVSDIEENRLLRVKVTFENTGTLYARPEIKGIIEKNEIEVGRFSYNETSVNIGETKDIFIEWDSTGQIVGDYEANVKVYLEGGMIKEKNLNFKILERGTFSAEGEIVNINVPTEVSGIGKIEVEFKNTGELDFLAKMKGDVYLEGELVDNLDSDEVLVKINESEIITAYFEPEKSGDYTVNAKMLYEGKTIEMDPISISVKSTKLITGKSVIPTLTNPVIIIAIIFGVCVIIFLIKRKKGGLSNDISNKNV